MTDVTLRAGAALARGLAPGHCRRDPATGETCAWWHGFVPYLRILGVTTEVAHHGRFFQQALAGPAGAETHARVLISGAVDWAMLAEILRIYDAAGAQVQVTVLDICETALRLNLWYAAQAGISIATVLSDIRDYRAEGGYDVVCTHSFLPLFDPADRSRVVETWRQILRPGGVAVTVNRIWRQYPDPMVRYTPEQRRAFIDSVRRAAAALAPPLDLGEQDLVRGAEAFSENLAGWPLRSATEMVELFEDAQFEIHDFQVRTIEGMRPYQASGPGSLGGSPYAMIAAIRR
jgi:SAM-dependent methyltransferase